MVFNDEGAANLKTIWRYAIGQLNILIRRRGWMCNRENNLYNAMKKQGFQVEFAAALPRKTQSRSIVSVSTQISHCSLVMPEQSSYLHPFFLFF